MLSQSAKSILNDQDNSLSSESSVELEDIVNNRHEENYPYNQRESSQQNYSNRGFNAKEETNLYDSEGDGESSYEELAGNNFEESQENVYQFDKDFENQDEDEIPDAAKRILSSSLPENIRENYSDEYDLNDVANSGEYFMQENLKTDTDYLNKSEAEISFEEFVPAVPSADLRKRIDDYFDLAFSEYTLVDDTKVWAYSQFRYGWSGQKLKPEKAKELIHDTLNKTKAGAKFVSENKLNIHYAAYGRAKPVQIQKITQALIDSGEFAKLKAEDDTVPDDQVIRSLQRKFGVGIDCAGYVQLAYIYAYTGSDDDPGSLRVKMGLQEKRGDESLAWLPLKHFDKLDALSAQTGDLLIMNPRAGEIDNAGHTVIVAEHTSTDSVHSFIVDASWGTDMYGLAAGGIGRRTLHYDTTDKIWWDEHPLEGDDVNKNKIGPYGGHPVQGVYRPKVAPATSKETFTSDEYDSENEGDILYKSQEYDKEVFETESGTYNKNLEGESDEHESIKESLIPDYQLFINEVNYLVKDWSKAIRLNKYYGSSLGWNKYFEKINTLLLPFSGYQNISLGDEAFAQAVANWQSKQGFSSKECDGTIGPNTWKKMKPLLVPGAASPPPSGKPAGAPADAQLETELNNNPTIKTRYQTVQNYKPVRESVAGWGISDPPAYIEASINEWNNNTSIHIHFDKNFDGDAHRSYLNLKRLYQGRGINDPAGYFSAKIVSITFFNRNTPGHTDLKAALASAQNSLVSAGNNYNLTSAWSFVPRTFNDNINKLSNHALGKAIDINPSSNPHITSSDEILVINAICKSIIPGGLLAESNPEVLLRASLYFQNNFNDSGINQEPQNVRDAAKRKRSTLDRYALNGFMTLPVNLVRALQNAGLNWGGTWRSAKDFMHFELPNP